MHTIFKHYRRSTGGAATVAATVTEEGLKVAIAECNPKDQFCKKVGRTIAEGRLKHPRYDYKMIVGLTPDLTTIDGRKEALAAIQANYFLDY